MMSTGTKIRNIGLAASAIAAPIIGIGAVVVRAAMDAETSTAKLNTAFKTAGLSAKSFAGQVDGAEASGRKFGFENTATREALAKLLVATGNAGKSFADLGVTMDLARFKHIDLGSAAQILASAMAGNQRAVKQLGISMAPVTLATDALRRSHVDLTTVQGRAELATAKLADKQATAAAVIAKVTEKVKGQADAFSKTSAGGLATFQAGLNNLEEKVGAKILPLLNRFVDWMNSSLIPALSKMGPIFDRVGSVISASWSVIGPIVQGVATVIKGAIEIIKGALEIITGILTGDWSKAWQGVRDVVGGVTTEISGYVSAMSAVITGVFGGIGSAISGAVGGAAGAASDLGTGIYNGVVDGVGDIAGWVGDRITDAVSAVTGGIGSALTEATSFGGNILQGLKTGIVGFAEWVGGRITAGIAALTGALGRALTAGTQFGTKILTGLKDGILGFTGWIGDRATEGIGAITGAAGRAFTAASGFGGRILAGMKDGITGFASSISITVENGWKAISGWADSAYTAALRFGGRILDGIVDGLKALGGKLVDLIVSPINRIIDGINAIKIPGWGGLSIGSKSVLGVEVFPGLTIGGWGPIDPIPGDIGHLAMGGPAMRGRAYIVGEHGPELFTPGTSGTVTPNSKLGRSVEVHYHYEKPPEDVRLWAWQVGYDLAAVGS